MNRLFVLFLSVFLFSCNSEPYQQGKILYTNFCANCHMEDGSGLKGLIPPLAGSDFLQLRAQEVPCIIRYGLSDTLIVNGNTYAQPMAGIPQLSEFEIANIINYLGQAWENDLGYTPLGSVREALSGCEK